MKSRDAFRLNVKDHMTRQGLKVKDLADMVNLSASYLSLVLSGERANLSDPHKDAIALALGTSVADLYTTGSRDGAGTSAAPAATALKGPTAEPGFLLRRTRDVSPFEDLLRVLNVTDRLLLLAFYRELNSLSDDDVRKIGGMFRNVLTAWQSALQESQAAAPVAVSTAGASPVEPDHRTLLWLVSYLSSLVGDVPLSAVSTALSWTQERIHRSLEGLLSTGAVHVVSAGSGEAGGATLLRPSGQVDLATSSQWISADARRGVLLALARGIESDSKVRPEHLAQMYLEGGDLRKAREWYGHAAMRAVDAGMWRIAKTYLLVVSSLDAVLGTLAEDRVSTSQMLVSTCQNLGETDEALAYQERNLAYWERSGRDSDLVRGLLSAGSILARRREWGRAEAYLDRALALSSKDFSGQARVRIGLAAVLAERGLLQRCKDEYDRALDLAGKSQEPGIMAHALLGLGKVFLWRRDYQKCAQYLNRALSLSEKKETALEVLTRTEMGKLRFHEGRHALAREHLEKAVKAAAEIGNQESGNAAKAWLSRCLGKGGEIADLEAKSDLATTARDFFFVLGERHGLIASLIACAEAEAALNRPAEAEAAFSEAVSEARISENPLLEALACEAYGLYLEGRDEDLAQVMLERSRWARSKAR